MSNNVAEAFVLGYTLPGVCKGSACGATLYFVCILLAAVSLQVTVPANSYVSTGAVSKLKNNVIRKCVPKS